MSKRFLSPAFLGIAFLILTVFVSAGCSKEWQDKFVRKKKEEIKPAQFEITQPHRPYEELYKEHFNFWKNWHRQLIQDLGTNRKRERQDMRETRRHLEALQKYLHEDQAAIARGYLERFDRVTERLKRWRVSEIDYSISEEDLSTTSSEKVVDLLTEQVLKKYKDAELAIGAKDLREIERQLLLMVIDHYWKEHLYSMDHLKEAIRFRGYAQKDPLQEYKREGLKMFEGTLDRIAVATSERFMHIDTGFIVKQKEALAQRAAEYEQQKKDQIQRGADVSRSFAQSGPAAPVSQQSQAGPQRKSSSTPVQVAEKVGRNDPCPCGSGKKFKKCHGAGGR